MASRRHAPTKFPSGWLTATEVANRYGVSHSDVCYHLRRGTLPGTKFANTIWMVNERDLPADLPPPGPRPAK
jgi:hypothetical protein